MYSSRDSQPAEEDIGDCCQYIFNMSQESSSSQPAHRLHSRESHSHVGEEARMQLPKNSS